MVCFHLHARHPCPSGGPWHRSLKLLASVLLAGLLAGTVLPLGGLLAQASPWTQKTGLKLDPGRRFDHGMAFDSARGVTVVFGGQRLPPGTRLNDTWEWDGSRWTNKTPASSPPARCAYTMAYDAARKRSVIFGGLGPGLKWLGDTWVWDGKAWTEAKPILSPPARNGHALAFDPVRKVVVLYGGRGASGVLSDTWEWDGSKWTNKTPSSGGPGKRQAHAMAYHARSKGIVLFGGESGSFFADTWVWNGTTWAQQKPGTMPTNRSGHRMAWDLHRDIIVLFGGEGGSNFSDTWEWDGTNWKKVPVSGPNKRKNCGMAYDSTRRFLVLFAGEDWPPHVVLKDTWEYRVGTTNASFTSIGVGCKGSTTGIPVLGAKTLPVLGKSLTLTLTGGPAVHASLLILGTVLLKFDMTPLGAPGCFAYTDPKILLGPFMIGLTGTWSGNPSFHIPLDTRLLGGSIYFQAFVVDPEVNALKLFASNGAKATVGW